ncbi:MAG TPA: hypothetical protein VGA53_01855 [Candidatus Paceibacterota bacterium]
MRALYTDRFKKSYRLAPDRVQKYFDKQIVYLLQDLRHPSLRAKKYDEARGIWQARVTLDWRFYFLMKGDIYYLVDIMHHPK